MTTASLLQICSFLLFAGVVLASTKWPSGTYVILRAQSGCPSSSGFKWRTGWRFQDTQDIFPSNAHSGNFHLDASVDKNNLKRSFCLKTDSTDDSTRPQWPKGKYCIYKKGSCPKGLKSGYITWDDEDWFNKNSKGGALPDGVYDKNTKIYYCCRTDGNKAEPVELPTTKPFFLVAYESASCQQVKWAEVSSEWIRFDTEEDEDGYGGAYPYGAGLNDHTIHYCYYTSCNYTLTKSSGLFQSPNYPNSYPAGQYCSWKIKVPEGLQVVLKFPKFSLQSGANTDNVQLYDGPNETLPSLGVYSGDKVPPSSGVHSSSNELLVIFKTDSKINFAGFQASYTAQRPTQLPTTAPTKTTSKQTTKSTTTAMNTGTSTSASVTEQTTQPFTTIKSTVKNAQTTKRTTSVELTTNTAQTTLVATTIKRTTENSQTTEGTTATTTTKENTKTPESTAVQSTTMKVKETTPKTQTEEDNIKTTLQATDEPSKTPATSQTTVYTKKPTATLSEGSSLAPDTKSKKPTHARPTEFRPSNIAPPRNESLLGYRKMEESRSSNVTLIVVPMLCLLLLAICLLMLFLYRKRNQRRKNKLDSEQFVYYESHPDVKSVDNPLYESGVKFTCASMDNPLYDGGPNECAVNPLYTAKRQITNYCSETSTTTVMSLESHDQKEYETLFTTPSTKALLKDISELPATNRKVITS